MISYSGARKRLPSRAEQGARPGTVLHSDNTVRMNGTAVEWLKKSKKIPARMMRWMAGTPLPPNHHPRRPTLDASNATTHLLTHSLGQGLGFSINVRYDRPRVCLHLLFVAISGVGKKKFFFFPQQYANERNCLECRLLLYCMIDIRSIAKAGQWKKNTATAFIVTTKELGFNPAT